MTFALGSRYPLSRRGSVALLLSAALAGCSSSSPAAGGGGGGGGGGGSCTLPPASTLTVAQVTPANLATGVFIGTDVSVRFNTCLDPTTITSTNVMLASFGFVSGSLGYDAATATVTFHPAAKLAYNTVYILGVTPGVKGAHGETMALAFGSNFTTQLAPDTTAPTTAAVPPGGSYNTSQSVALGCTDNVGGTGCGATYYTVDGSTPTTASTRYALPITVAQSLTLRFFSVDVQGNAETPKQEVYVIDIVPPTLTGNVPANGATQVPVTQVMTATFSEEMKASTLTPATVAVDNGVTVTLSYAAGGTLTITPTERLACNTTYHVSIGAGATDVAGNALVQPATFSFTTTSDCQEPVTTASVAGGVYRTAQNVALACTDAGGSGCARIVYTTDGTVPSLDPPTNGTIVTASTTGAIAIGVGDTVLRYFSEDGAGNREVLRQQIYSVSTTGFTFVATNGGLARGVGQVPAKLVPILPGGRTFVFFRDPSNSRLYRGTDRGLLFSDDGVAWTLAGGSAGAPGAYSVFARGSKVFAGTGNGLYVSADGGATFARRDLGSANWIGSVIATGYTVYLATGAGVAVSADKGETFALRTTVAGLGSNSVRDLYLDPVTGSLYAATGGGLSISTDGGASFTNYTTGLTSVSVNAIAVSGSSVSVGTVYVGTDNGLFSSTDGGHSFLPTGLAAAYVGAVFATGSTVYAGTGQYGTGSFAVSTDGGTTFTTHALHAFNPSVDAIYSEGPNVWVGAYPSYYYSTDGGVSFVPMDLRGAVVKVTGLAGVLYAALSDSSGYGGLAISTDDGRSFVVRDGRNGIPSYNVDDVAAASPSAGVTDVFAATFSGLGVSTNGGASFANKTVNGAAGGNVDCVWAGGATVWACGGNTLNLSTTSGGTFTQKLSASPGVLTGVTASGTSWSNVYLATSSGLYVSGNGGSTFALRGTPDGLLNTGLSGVAVDGAGKVLAASNSSGGPNGLYVSSDNGVTFTSVGTGMYPRGIHASGNVWYAASTNLSITTDGGVTWTVLGTSAGLPDIANDVWYTP